MQNEKLEIGSVLRLHVADLNSTGQGVASYGSWKIFIDGALPEEEVDARLVLRKKNYGVAELTAIYKRSELRVEPPCRFFGACGGCQLQHLSYSGQLAYKTQRLGALLEGNYNSKKNVGIHGAPNPLHYRTKVQLVAAPAEGGFQLGFFARGSHRVVPVSTCLVHGPTGDQVQQELNSLAQQSQLEAYDENSGRGKIRQVMIRSSHSQHEALIVLFTTSQAAADPLIQRFANQLMQIPAVIGVVQLISDRPGNALIGGEEVLLAGRGHVQEKLNGISFAISARSFFQVNPVQAEHAFNRALSLANVGPNSKVIDLFSGTGTIALLAAARGAEVLGLEIEAAAVADAEKNARNNKISGAQFQQANLLNSLDKSGLPENLNKKILSDYFDTIFVDPPRKGLSTATIDWIKQIGPSKIIYISCDPATLARDLRILQEDKFTCVHIEATDFFPQTNHIETISLLERK